MLNLSYGKALIAASNGRGGASWGRDAQTRRSAGVPPAAASAAGRAHKCSRVRQLSGALRPGRSRSGRVLAIWATRPWHCSRSAGFQTCCIADFQIGSAPKCQRPLGLSKFADLEIRDTADLEVGATGVVCGCVGRGRIMFFPCTQRHSSLQTVPEAAKPRATWFCFHPFFQASPCFETLCDMANGFVQRRKQPVGVRPATTPIDMTICDRPAWPKLISNGMLIR
jgi:hypothetical protein